MPLSAASKKFQLQGISLLFILIQLQILSSQVSSITLTFYNNRYRTSKAERLFNIKTGTLLNIKWIIVNNHIGTTNIGKCNNRQTGMCEHTRGKAGEYVSVQHDMSTGFGAVCLHLSPVSPQRTIAFESQSSNNLFHKCLPKCPQAKWSQDLQSLCWFEQ